jgi:mannose-6-phosphate isomerase-like protein (cupin superfamily)
LFLHIAEELVTPRDPDIAYRFDEIPGLRGIRVARVGRQDDGRTLEIVEGAAGVVIPMLHHPSAEHGRVLRGRVRFMKDGVVRDLGPGDTWDVAADEAQGPHVILDDLTRIALLRDGHSAFDEP